MDKRKLPAAMACGFQKEVFKSRKLIPNNCPSFSWQERHTVELVPQPCLDVNVYGRCESTWPGSSHGGEGSRRAG